MSKKTRHRAVKSLRRAKISAPQDSMAKSQSGLFSPEMQRAHFDGLKMILAMAFPALPALLQDLWVYLELSLTIVGFALGLIGQFPITVNKGFQYSYFILTLISLILALIDGYTYFIETGSCVRAYRQLSPRYSYSEDEEDVQFQRKSLICSKAVKEKIFTYFELGRTILSELLLYPILIFDLFSFITCQSYLPADELDRVDFGLFIIGSFYLILAVYIMRIFVVVGSLISLISIPVGKNSSDAPDMSLMIKFCIHVLGEMLVHLMVILVVGAKIENENMPDSNMVNGSTNNDDNDDDPIIFSSPFLWVSIVLGWLLPLAGTATFFIVNYYWMREFSVSFWVNMNSLLQGQSFAETVFEGHGIEDTKEKTLAFIEQINYLELKKQLSKYKPPPWWFKFLYPVRVPLAAICGFVYDICLIVFITSLALTYDFEENTVKVVIFKDDVIMTSLFIISAILILLVNFHIIVLFGLVFLLALMYAIIVLFVLLILLISYFPLTGLIGYYLFFKHCCTCSKDKKNDTNAIIEMDEL